MSQDCEWPIHGAEDVTGVLKNEVWMPRFIKDLLAISDLPVIYYDDSLKENVLYDCREAEHVGATYMCLDSARNVLFCLTTEDKIYVIDMKHRNHVSFLRELLLRNDLKLYIIGGQYGFFKLHTEFGITLKSIFDLHTVDIFIQMRKNISRLISTSRKYVGRSFYEDSSLLLYRNRIQLQDRWLSVKLPDINKARERKETKIILENQDSVEAKNVIRLRSFATRELGRTMFDEIGRMKRLESDNIYKFALQVTNDAYTDYENLDCDEYSTVMRYLNNGKPLTDLYPANV